MNTEYISLDTLYVFSRHICVKPYCDSMPKEAPGGIIFSSLSIMFLTPAM